MFIVQPKKLVNIIITICILALSLSLASSAAARPDGPQGADDATAINLHGGDISSDETWHLADNPHILQSNVNVLDGVTLTIEAGVIVLAEKNTHLKILGNLQAIGNSSQRITFTISDTVKIPGDWGGIEFNDALGDGDGTGNLTYVDIEYARNAASPCALCIVEVQAPITLTSITVQHSADNGLYADQSKVNISNASFSNNGNNDQDSGLLARRSSVINITSSTFNDNTGFGIFSDGGAKITLDGVNVIQSNNGYPLATNVNNLPLGALDNVSYASNNPNYVLTWGTLADNLTIPSVPGLDGIELLEDVTISTGYKLTVMPPNQVRGRGDSGMIIQGGLEVSGVDGSPVTFTSQSDTDISPWGGLKFMGGSGSLNYANVRYAQVPGLNAAIEAIDVVNGEVSLNHTTISHNPGHGLSATNSQISLQHSQITQNGETIEDVGLLAVSGSHVDAAYTRFDENGGHGLRAEDDNTRVSLYGGSVSNNTRQGIYVPFGAVSLAITATQILDNQNNGIHFFGSLDANVRYAQIHNNGENGVNNQSPGTCFRAQANYWGALAGPNDPSGAADDCMGAVSNASPGEGVSDDVDYSGWVGEDPQLGYSGADAVKDILYTDLDGLDTTITATHSTFNTPTVLLYSPLSSPPHAIPHGMGYAGETYSLQVFGSVPVSVTPGGQLMTSVEYNSDDVQGLLLDSLALFIWQTNEWVDVRNVCGTAGTYVHDTGERILTVAACGPGEYVLMATDPTPSPLIYLPLLSKDQ